MRLNAGDQTGSLGVSREGEVKSWYRSFREISGPCSLYLLTEKYHSPSVKDGILRILERITVSSRSDGIEPSTEIKQICFVFLQAHSPSWKGRVHTKRFSLWPLRAGPWTHFNSTTQTIRSSWRARQPPGLQQKLGVRWTRGNVCQVPGVWT